MPSSQVENTSGGTLVGSHTYTYNPNGDKTGDVAKVMNAGNTSAYLNHRIGGRVGDQVV